jgi:predicted nuclease of restriction endonuclease-like (RecB) superfamily
MYFTYYHSVTVAYLQPLNSNYMADNTNSLSISENDLFNELSQLIEQSKQQIAIQANSAVTILFWQVGNRINQDILQNKRAAYGKQIVPTLSTQLENKYGRNFEEKNLRRMMQFAEQFTDFQIVVTLSRQLSWSHYLAILPIKTHEAKVFYANQVGNSFMSVRELRRQIALKAFERTNIADAQIIETTHIPFNTFKDPYILDLLGLQNTFLEKDLEDAILHDLETFILELGKGFTFVERQKRMIIDGEDFNLDLLFYHRKLKRLVAIELKLGKFQAKHKGQMELYLKWLDKYEKQEGENTPIGLILCAESSREQIELLEMHKDGILVAEYWTDLPPKKQFEEKIHLLLTEARERIERKKLL